jgi:hypothetical protein
MGKYCMMPWRRRGEGELEYPNEITISSVLIL